jgi:hypothetical protein
MPHDIDVRLYFSSDARRLIESDISETVAFIKTPINHRKEVAFLKADYLRLAKNCMN